MAHILHKTAHLVTGDFGLSQIVKLVGKRAIIFGNKKYPHLPIVLKTNNVPGILESTLCLDLLHETSVHLNAAVEPTVSLRTQVALEMEIGLKKFGDEIVLLGKLDD
jgi:hypothetical protein